MLMPSMIKKKPKTNGNFMEINCYNLYISKHFTRSLIYENCFVQSELATLKEIISTSCYLFIF